MKRFLHISNKTKVGLLILTVLFFVCLLIFEPLVSLFNITVNTERISFLTKDENNSRLVFENVEIDGLESILFANFSGSFEIGKETNVTIERISFGPAIITVENRNGKTTGKLYHGEDGSFLMNTPSFLEFVIDSLPERAQRGQTILLPVDGDVAIGRAIDMEIYGEGSSLLREGNISITGQSKFWNEEFEAGQKQLLLGDQLIFEGIVNKAFGFATINENPGIQAAYRVKAKNAKILKPGPRNENGGITVKARPFDRLFHASSYQIISLIFGTLVILTSLGSFLLDLINSKENIKAILK